MIFLTQDFILLRVQFPNSNISAAITPDLKRCFPVSNITLKTVFRTISLHEVLTEINRRSPITPSLRKVNFHITKKIFIITCIKETPIHENRGISFYKSPEKMSLTVLIMLTSSPSFSIDSMENSSPFILKMISSLSPSLFTTPVYLTYLSPSSL